MTLEDNIKNDTKILMNTDDKFLDNISFKRLVILMVCVIKDDNKFYPHKFYPVLLACVSSVKFG